MPDCAVGAPETVPHAFVARFVCSARLAALVALSAVSALMLAAPAFAARQRDFPAGFQWGTAIAGFQAVPVVITACSWRSRLPATATRAWASVSCRSGRPVR